MGCETAQAVSVVGQFGEGTGPVWLDDLFCSGKESSLTECYQVRLAGSGSTRCSGRVEVYLNGAWGTVCDDRWDLNDAQVVCRQLGCGTALSAPGSAHFGQGTGPVWLADVACTGEEETLFKCSNSNWKYKCAHNEDAGMSLRVSRIRLVGSGSTRCSGRVEVYHNGVWGTVCDDDWDFNDTQVVCRQLGCDTRDIVPLTPRFGEGIGQIWLDDVSCLGNESSLTDCQHKGFGNHNCRHTEDVDVGVVCSGYQVRLAGSGSTRCSGRVEVYQNVAWGTVCDDRWDLNDAQVVCRQLGCGTALSAPGSAHFGQGTGPVWLADVACTGEEETLFKCSNSNWKHKCAHNEDAGVVCSGMMNIIFYFFNSTVILSGVQVSASFVQSQMSLFFFFFFFKTPLVLLRNTRTSSPFSATANISNVFDNNNCSTISFRNTIQVTLSSFQVFY
uniref:Soluble scavenger receptor cysteine-rich domain-containing protein SSC5D n=1 Tax=Sphaeramia orbicularis TaxID=375764 RepID=A0A673C1U6_9TELE